jgi:hypothetical protein
MQQLPYFTSGYLSDLWKYSPSTNEWTWMSGSNGSYVPGVYGTQGIPSTLNYPGSRAHSVSWIDSNGFLWLFGGVEGYYGKSIEMQQLSDSTSDWFNDLWKYSPSTNEWTWVSGNNTGFGNYIPGVYGTQGIPSTVNYPGRRDSSVSWMDGFLWLFGGFGLSNDGNDAGSII